MKCVTTIATVIGVGLVTTVAAPIVLGVLPAVALPIVVTESMVGPIIEVKDIIES